MRIVITGATGNLGTALIRVLQTHDPEVEIVGIARRPPSDDTSGVEWRSLDLTAPGADVALAEAMQGADAVVHLAWAIQPVREHKRLHTINVGGTAALLRAVATAGVPQLVHTSSIAVYGPERGPVDENRPSAGIPASTYSQDKVEAEKMVAEFVRTHPEVAVAVLRPTLVVQRDAAMEIAELFLGSRKAMQALGKARGRLPVIPLPAGLRMQIVHADDVAEATVRVLQRKARGPFNLAAETLEARDLAALLGARPLPIPRRLVRGVVGLAYRARLIPSSPGWFDMLVEGPVADTSRARYELGWQPRYSSRAAAEELLESSAAGASGTTPALR
jgi:UDP-glucose 4-epimerase